MLESSTLNSLLAFSEELHQRIDVRLVGIDGDVVDAAGIEKTVAVSEVFVGGFFQLHPKGRSGGVDPDDLAVFRVLQIDQPEWWKVPLDLVLQADGDDIMLAVGDPQIFLVAFRKKIAEEKNGGLPPENVVETVQPHGQIRAAVLRPESENVMDDAQHMAAPLLWLDEVLDLVGEHQQADAIAIVDRRERQDGGYLGQQVRLGPLACAELRGGARIDQEDDRHFALFGEQLDVRAARPGRHVPVNPPHVVAND